MRKLAVAGPGGGKSGVGGGGVGGKRGATSGGTGVMADLIELESTSEATGGAAGGGEDSELQQRTPTMPAGPARMPSTGLPSIGGPQEQKDENQDGLGLGLDERFPVRGRVKSAYDAGK